MIAAILADLMILANVIAGEAPYCPQEHQIAVAAVVLNRVADARFPGTLAGVVGQEGQYSSEYLEPRDEWPEGCLEAARMAMAGEHDVPKDVIYQANFRQGDVWWISEVDTGYWQSTTYFCRG